MTKSKQPTNFSSKTRMEALSVGKSAFPFDYYNLLQSEYAKDKGIFVDPFLKQSFMEKCRDNIALVDSKVYGDLDPYGVVDGITYKRLEEITLCGLDAGNILWVTYGTQFGSPSIFQEYKPFLERMSEIAVVSFSSLSGMYTGISLYNIKQGKTNERLIHYWGGIEDLPPEPDEIVSEFITLVIRKKPFYDCYRGNIMKFSGENNVEFNDDIMAIHSMGSDLDKPIDEIVDAGLKGGRDFVLIESANNMIADNFIANEEIGSYPVDLRVDWLTARFIPLFGRTLIRYNPPPMIEQTCDGWKDNS